MIYLQGSRKFTHKNVTFPYKNRKKIPSRYGRVFLHFLGGRPSTYFWIPSYLFLSLCRILSTLLSDIWRSMADLAILQPCAQSFSTMDSSSVKQACSFIAPSSLEFQQRSSIGFYFFIAPIMASPAPVIIALISTPAAIRSALAGSDILSSAFSSSIALRFLISSSVSLPSS